MRYALVLASLALAAGSLAAPAATANPEAALLQDPGYKYHHGGLGPTHIVGHDGNDYMVDPVGGDADVMDDSPGDGPDGHNDVMDATDGDDQDVMIGGLEDTFRGDPGDTVIILGEPDEQGNVPVIFKGRLDLWQEILELIVKITTWTPFF